MELNYTARKYLFTAITVIIGTILVFAGTRVFRTDYTKKTINVGFIYMGDQSNFYTNNFYRSQMELEATFDNVKTIAKYNIPENREVVNYALYDLVSKGCNLIFTTSYGYSKAAKQFAAEHPNVQICQATGNNANEIPFVPNYHTFMGRIYEGRYISGVVAGMKLLDLIQKDMVPRSNAKIGYIGTYPSAEVISGYTAFFLGVRSIVPEAIMTVRYTDTWNNYITEKKCAEKLIYEDNCVIISQHSDTTGPASACEVAHTKKGKIVYHVGYNQSMTDIAPKTSLVSCRINWSPYVCAATEAVLKEKKIESVVKATIRGTDSGGGISQQWVEMIGLNKVIAALGTEAEIEHLAKQFKDGEITVFKGSYIGVNPYNHNDTWDLRTPYPENSIASAPGFTYVLKDVIEVK
ncbi:MAG: BMP family ABC transporter substrate-binding protein [Treponema sp.]|nr:BMP family ABC transporter substrate-binding protein [Treponema sp.]